jgi:hypothetical protein
LFEHRILQRHVFGPLPKRLSTQKKRWNDNWQGVQYRRLLQAKHSIGTLHGSLSQIAKEQSEMMIGNEELTPGQVVDALFLPWLGGAIYTYHAANYGLWDALAAHVIT